MAYTHDKHNKKHPQDKGHQMAASLTHSRIHSQTKNKQAHRHDSNVIACKTTNDQNKLMFLPMILLQLVAGVVGLGLGAIGLSKPFVGAREANQFPSLLHFPQNITLERVERISRSGSGPKKEENEKKENKDEEKKKNNKKEDDNLKKWNSKVKGCKSMRPPSNSSESANNNNNSSSESDSDSENNNNSSVPYRGALSA